MVFLWSLSDNKSPQISRILFSILAVLNNAVVSMVFTHPPNSKSSSFFKNPLATVPKAPIGMIITIMFHSPFFNSLAKSRYLSFFSLSFCFILWSAGTTKIHDFASSHFYYYKVWSSGRDWVIRLDVIDRFVSITT